MPASQFTPVEPNSYLWTVAHSVFEGCPVVATGVAFTVDNPAVSSADIIIGVAVEDAGPAALNDAVNKDVITVQEYGVAKCYAKGAITVGTWLKVGATISVTPPGYASAVTMQTVTAATQAGAGAQPFPMVGIAMSAASADGDIVYVDVKPGSYF